MDCQRYKTKTFDRKIWLYNNLDGDKFNYSAIQHRRIVHGKGIWCSKNTERRRGKKLVWIRQRIYAYK